jgi:hypothetical protein
MRSTFSNALLGFFVYTPSFLFLSHIGILFVIFQLAYGSLGGDFEDDEQQAMDQGVPGVRERTKSLASIYLSLRGNAPHLSTTPAP